MRWVLGLMLVVGLVACSKKSSEERPSPSEGGGQSGEPAASGAPASSIPDGEGRVVMVLSVDWEGAYFDPDGLDALDRIEKELGDAPLTHFICPAYFTRPSAEGSAAQTIGDMVREQDEVGLHIHLWKSLVRAAGVEPRTGPSFLTEELMAFEDGDVGFEVRLDAYERKEIVAILEAGRKLLTDRGLEPSTAFRAGGFVGTPMTFTALGEAGFEIDSSASPPSWYTEGKGALPGLIEETWPDVDTSTQPHRVASLAGSLIEVPISGGFVEYVSTEEMLEHLSQAAARLSADPDEDLVVGFGFHQEAGGEYEEQMLEVIRAARARLGDRLRFATVSEAAKLAPDE